MILRRNEDAIGKIIQADARGDSRKAVKPLFVARNAFDVDLDESLYRITPAEWLLQDMREGQFTHTRISPDTWFDDNENPLAEKTFVGAGNETISFASLMRDMFGSCWSIRKLGESADWASFSHGKKSIRIESTPRKLLTAVMADTNPYADLQHAIGRVRYCTREELIKEFEDPNWDKYLDPLGQGIFLSLLKLTTQFEDESEVRLMCNFMPRERWVQENARLEGHLLKVPFVWNDVVNSIEVGPYALEVERSAIVAQLKEAGYGGDITHCEV